MAARNAKERLSKPDFCGMFGLSESQLTRLFAQGMPHEKAANRKVYVPMPTGRIWYHAYLEEKGRKAGAPKDFDEGRARKMMAEAELAELDLAKARAELMTLTDYTQAIEDTYTRVRAKLVNFPARAAPIVFGASSIQDAERRLRPICDETIDELRAAEDLDDEGSVDDGEDDEDDDGLEPDGQPVGPREPVPPMLPAAALAVNTGVTCEPLTSAAAPFLIERSADGGLL